MTKHFKKIIFSFIILLFIFSISTIFTSAISKTDLYSWYNFDGNASLNITDLHTGGHNLVITGIGISNSTGIIKSGKIWSSFVNTSGKYTLTKTFNPTWSINTWYFQNSTTNTQNIFTLKATNYNIQLYPISSGYHYMQIRNSSNTYINGTIGISGSWNMITLTYDGNTLKYYLNGVLDNQKTGFTPYFTPTSVEIGSMFGDSIDEFSVWDKPLTTTDIAELYNFGSGITYNQQSIAGNILTTKPAFNLQLYTALNGVSVSSYADPTKTTGYDGFISNNSPIILANSQNGGLTSTTYLSSDEINSGVLTQYQLAGVCDFKKSLVIEDTFTSATPYLNNWNSGFYINLGTDDKGQLYTNSNNKMILRLNNASAPTNNIYKNFTTITNNNFEFRTNIAVTTNVTNQSSSMVFELLSTTNQIVIPLNVTFDDDNNKYCVYYIPQYETDYQILGCTDAVYTTINNELAGITIYGYINMVDDSYSIRFTDFNEKNYYTDVIYNAFDVTNINKVYMTFLDRNAIIYVGNLQFMNVSNYQDFTIPLFTNESGTEYVFPCVYDSNATYTACLYANIGTDSAYNNKQCFDINSRLVYSGTTTDNLNNFFGTDLTQIPTGTKLFYAVMLLLVTAIVIIGLTASVDMLKLGLIVTIPIEILEIVFLVVIGFIPTYVVVLLLIISATAMTLLFKQIFISDNGGG